MELRAMFLHCSMSLHTRCQQRIASTSVHRTVWRRRCMRYYASDATKEPEWFQKVRTELLSRRPHHHREELDPLHYEQLCTTLIGFTPNTIHYSANSRPNISLAELLTRFNVRVQSSNLLSDGTDPLHHPGEPWMRRMWAGGAVKIRPDLNLDPEARTEVPFRLKQRVACLERIKDVRLQGTGDEAKIFVTIERRFAPRGADEGESEGILSANNFKRAIRDNDWSDSLVREERNLVFMKAKTAAELTSVTSGQGLGATRYLKSLENPDYSFPLTPTRSLLFRYSAVTYNAHLIHLDPTYARYVEGHRNILVHGPLTLTLMLQVLNKHLKLSQIAQGPEAITSIEYRNMAPLYCDEEMRICVKKKKRTDTGHSWDVWIEGPTGGMAVKAVAHTAVRSAGAVFTNRAVDSTATESVEDTTAADLPEVQTADLPEVHTVALQAQDKLNALDQEDSGKEQLSQVSREERRKLVRQEQVTELDISRPETPSLYQEYSQYSRAWRKQWIGKSLRYLYMSSSSPLCNDAVVPRQSRSSSQSTVPARRSQAKSKRNLEDHAPYSNLYRKIWVGRSLQHLYLWPTSPLINNAVVSRESAQMDAAPAPTKTSKLLKDSVASTVADPAPDPPAALPSWRERQRLSLLRGSPSAALEAANTPSGSDAAPPVKIRSIGTDAPEGIFPFLKTQSMQDEQDIKRLEAARKKEERPKGKLTVKKVEGVRIRKTDIDLKEVERKRAHAKRVDGENRREGGGGKRNDVLSVLQAAQGKGTASE